MTTTLTAHLAELAETLDDLRRRFRQAARVEVANAIGEALRQVSLALICGPVPSAAGVPGSYAAWHDPWQDPTEDPWQAHRGFSQEVDMGPEHRASPLTFPPAVLAGLGVARWSFVRTRQLGPAVLVGLLVAFAASTGGPIVKALLEAWSAATDLLSFPGPDRRP